MTAALRCAGVAKAAASGEPILRGVSFAVEEGTAVALMGANGAGKTTLLDIVCGLTSPTAGEVSVFGRGPRPAVRAGWVGGMLQSGGLLPELTVAETLRVVAALFGVPDAADPARHGLERLAGRRIGTCSGGEQQWVKWALARIPGPRLLVLDEPTAGMDWAARRRFWGEVAGLRSEGVAVLYATHYADEVEGIADAIVLLDAGRVAAVTTPADAAALASGAATGSGLFDGLARLVERAGPPEAGEGRRRLIGGRHGGGRREGER